jgi:4-hydroxy-tetrahydrodipicolinate synthase
LTDDEKLALFRAVADAVSVPVIAGTGSNDTAHSVELTRKAAGTGVSGILAVTPYYNRPSQAGIEAHFRAIAGASDLPVLLYDIPIRAGRKIAHDVLVRLVTDVPTIIGTKDAALDVAASARLMADVPDIVVYSGNDDQTLPLMSVGAVGVISVAAHWCAAEMGDMIRAFSKGDIEGARTLNARMIPSFLFETGDAAPNPVPTKAMMRTLGHAVGECRLPMGPTPAGLEDEARRVFAALRS